MFEPIGVECHFSADGRVHVRRIERDGRWLPVGQGRQWVDNQGRHVLVMLPDESVLEIVQQAETLTWVIRPRAMQNHII